MAKKIVIKTCEDCPHKDHTGGFGRVMYVPVCRETNKKLGYQVRNQGIHVVAVYDGIIPTWCPLEEN